MAKAYKYRPGRKSSDGWERFPALKSLDGKHHLCRWCRAPLDGRRTSWCNDKCKAEVMQRCYYVSARAFVEKRDKGVCRRCGLDTKDLRAALDWYEKLWYRLAFGEDGKVRGLARHWPSPQEFRKAVGKIAEGWPGDLWECNHIVPVSEGGAVADVANLESLCSACHLGDTREVQARAAARKREAKK